MDLPERGAVRTGTRGAVSRQPNHLPIVAWSRTSHSGHQPCGHGSSEGQHFSGREKQWETVRYDSHQGTAFHKLCYTSASIL